MRILFAVDPWIYRGTVGNQLYTLQNIFINSMKGLKQAKNDVRVLLGEDMNYTLNKKGIQLGCELIVIPLDKLYCIYSNHYEAHKIQFNELETKLQKEKTSELIKKYVGEWEPEIIISFTTPASAWKYIYKNALSLQFENGIFSRAPYPQLCQLDPFGFLKKSYPAYFITELRNSKISKEQEFRIRNMQKRFREDIFEKKNPIKKKMISTNKEEKKLLVPLSYNGVIINDESSKFKSQLDFLLYVLQRVPKNIHIFATRHSLQLNGSIPLETEEFLQEKYPNLSFCEGLNHYAFLSQWLTILVDGVVTLNSTVGYHAALFNKKVFALGDCEINSVATNTNLDNIERALAKDIDGNILNVLYHLFTRYSFSLQKFWDGPWLTNRLNQLLVAHKNGQLDRDWKALPLIDENEDKIFEEIINNTPGLKKDYIPRVYETGGKK